LIQSEFPSKFICQSSHSYSLMNIEKISGYQRIQRYAASFPHIPFSFEVDSVD